MPRAAKSRSKVAPKPAPPPAPAPACRRCRFRVCGYSGNGKTVHFHCRGCGARRERAIRKHERRFFKPIRFDRPDPLHKVGHEFRRLFCKKGVYPHYFKQEGWKLMEAVRKWAAKHPDVVTLVPIDDDHFMSSLLVLIDARTADRYMGTTVYVIPQRGGQPMEFFLYPGHRVCLIAALKAIHKVGTRIARRQEKLERERWAEINRTVKVD